MPTEAQKAPKVPQAPQMSTDFWFCWPEWLDNKGIDVITPFWLGKKGKKGVTKEECCESVPRNARELRFI